MARRAHSTDVLSRVVLGSPFMAQLHGVFLQGIALAGFGGLGCVAVVHPTGGEGQEKVVLCHKGKKTLEVAEPAADAHLRHGDTRGPCR